MNGRGGLQRFNGSAVVPGGAPFGFGLPISVLGGASAGGTRDVFAGGAFGAILHR
jgi:hypothetical protein